MARVEQQTPRCPKQQLTRPSQSSRLSSLVSRPAISRSQQRKRGREEGEGEREEGEGESEGEGERRREREREGREGEGEKEDERPQTFWNKSSHIFVSLSSSFSAAVALLSLSFPQPLMRLAYQRNNDSAIGFAKREEEVDRRNA